MHKNEKDPNWTPAPCDFCSGYMGDHAAGCEFAPAPFITLDSIMLTMEAAETASCGCRLVRVPGVNLQVRFFQCQVHTAAPELLELARAIVLEAGLITGAPVPNTHPRAWQNSGERWANLASAAIAKAEGR